MRREPIDLLGLVATTAPAARKHDQPTSLLGAERSRPRASSQRAKLLYAYAVTSQPGLTDDEAASLAGLIDRPGCCWWKRCSELRNDGLIEVGIYVGTSSPVTKPSPLTGEDRLVCNITEAGLELYRAIFDSQTER